jgi:hypothetical protein
LVTALLEALAVFGVAFFFAGGCADLRAEGFAVWRLRVAALLAAARGVVGAPRFDAVPFATAERATFGFFVGLFAGLLVARLDVALPRGFFGAFAAMPETPKLLRSSRPLGARGGAATKGA